ncbi:MAG: chromosome segregation protein [Acidimicrobiales bacterium]
MYLKALSIKGFKSFADPATLELEPGITVVVGPNGSGKSNVVDAMAWVLGAQAPSAVRSQKMDDVIFAGTASKAALGRAEVTLTIDNSQNVLPIEFTEVNITRTLFRTGESEYSINGVSCRLLDIQDLLSDSGVGRQQHIIISQGQIDAVLNARPEERRLIIEEAAGVLKFRKRKERAERRLGATDENLNRLQDLVREVRRQLRPLEKQADAARRYGDLVIELSGLKLHLAGRELKALTGQIEGAHRQRSELDARDLELKSTLARLDSSVLDAEAELAALGGSDVNDILSRARSMRERIGGQTNVVGERQRRLEGELQSAVDEGVVSSLEAEAARIQVEFEASESEKRTFAPEMAEIERNERTLITEQKSFEEDWGEGLGPAPAQAAEVRAQVSALRSAAERDQQEGSRIFEQLETLAERHDRLTRQRNAAAETVATLDSRLPALDTELARGVAEVEKAEAGRSATTERRRLADAEASRWAARADALAQALDAARSAAGVDALAGTDGVLGTLLDLIDVDAGWEPAIEAAAGEALSAVVVDDVVHGRAALAALAEKDLAGAVLALGSRRGPVGRPTVGTPVRARVRALRPDVEPLLDALLGDAVVVEGDWRQSLDAALDHPEVVVVTRDGDRFGPNGWRVGRTGTGATGAALTEAQAETHTATAAAEAAVSALEDAQRRIDDSTTELRRVEHEQRQATAALSSSQETIERVTAELVELETSRDRLSAQKSEIGRRQDVDRQQLDTLQLQLPGLEQEEAEHFDRAQTMADARTSLEERLRALASRRTDLEVRSAAVIERVDMLTNRRSEVEARLERLVAERAAARVRREELEAGLAVVHELAESLKAKHEKIGIWIGRLAAEQQEQSEAARRVSGDLSARRRERQSAEQELVQLRERHSKLDLNVAENNVRLETLTEAVRRDLDSEPDVAVAALCPELPDGASPESRTRELERELKLMGPINPLALEEFDELKERHEFLATQLEDVKSTKRDLHKLIREVDEQIVGVFSAAYADVATNFTELFNTLFPGGRGAVTLTNADDLLNCGVEIEAKPSGKNVKKLSLLSGGERSLTALGFLFAVFRSRPSPFYVMDEVEAALDDMNLNRFLALVQEFRKEAQLIIVSHQKRTMEAADVLYGVSMKPGGSSKVVSERVTPEATERLAEAAAGA